MFAMNFFYYSFFVKICINSKAADDNAFINFRSVEVRTGGYNQAMLPRHADQTFRIPGQMAAVIALHSSSPQRSFGKQSVQLFQKSHILQFDQWEIFL